MIFRTDKTLLSLLLLILGFCIVMQLRNGVAGDKEYIVNFSHMLLSGKKLYSGLFSALLAGWLLCRPVIRSGCKYDVYIREKDAALR